MVRAAAAWTRWLTPLGGRSAWVYRWERLEPVRNVDREELSLTVGGAGSIDIRTVVLMEASEVDAVAQRSAEYTPPGG